MTVCSSTNLPQGPRYPSTSPASLFRWRRRLSPFRFCSASNTVTPEHTIQHGVCSGKLSKHTDNRKSKNAVAVLGTCSQFFKSHILKSYYCILLYFTILPFSLAQHLKVQTFHFFKLLNIANDRIWWISIRYTRINCISCNIQHVTVTDCCRITNRADISRNIYY